MSSIIAGNAMKKYTPTSEKKKNSTAMINSIIVACSGGVKLQGRAANGPFGFHVKQPPKGDENMITKRPNYNIQYL